MRKHDGMRVYRRGNIGQRDGHDGMTECDRGSREQGLGESRHSNTDGESEGLDLITAVTHLPSRGPQNGYRLLQRHRQLQLTASELKTT